MPNESRCRKIPPTLPSPLHLYPEHQLYEQVTVWCSLCKQVSRQPVPRKYIQSIIIARGHIINQMIACALRLVTVHASPSPGVNKMPAGIIPAHVVVLLTWLQSIANASMFICTDTNMPYLDFCLILPQPYPAASCIILRPAAFCSPCPHPASSSSCTN